MEGIDYTFVLHSLTLLLILIFQYFISCKYDIVRFKGCYELLISPLGLVLKLVVDLGFLLNDLCESMLVLRLYVCGSLIFHGFT